MWVSINNANIIEQIATQYFKLFYKQFRVFTNRFGQQIYEDIIILQKFEL